MVAILLIVPFLVKYAWPIEVIVFLFTQTLYWTGYEAILRQALALGCAVGTPVIVMSLFMDYCVQKKQSAFKNIGWGHLFIEAVLLLWGCGILSLIGAIYISGILSDIRFFLEMNIFRALS